MSKATEAMERLSPLGSFLTTSVLRIFDRPENTPTQWMHDSKSLLVGIPTSAAFSRSISILEIRGVFHRQKVLNRDMNKSFIWVSLGPIFGVSKGQITVKKALAIRETWNTNGPDIDLGTQEADMAASKNGTKAKGSTKAVRAINEAKAKTAAKATKEKAPRKSKVDVTNLNPSGMLRKNDKGKWSWAPGNDAIYASVLKRIARGEGSAADKKFAFSTHFTKNEKVTDSSHMSSLLKAAQKAA